MLGRAMGFPDTEDGLPSDQPDRIIANTRKLHVQPESDHTPSMALDAQKGFPIEVEVIVGEVVRLAKEYKVDIPVCSYPVKFHRLTRNIRESKCCTRCFWWSRIKFCANKPTSKYTIIQ